MDQLKQVYKCNVCGHIIEVIHPGVGQLVCCNKPMEALKEKTEDAGQEKHVPIIERTASGIKVKVGAIPHPMEDKHFIEWVEIIADGRYCRKFLRPSDAPEAEFEIRAENVTARIYCNIHGLWKSK